MLVSSAANLNANNSNKTGKIEITDKTIKNRLKKICAESNGLLELDAFKVSGVYQFAPEYSALLLALMATDYYDERKSRDKEGVRKALNDQLVQNIHDYVSRDQEIYQKIISHDTYEVARYSDELRRHIIEIIVRSVYAIFQTDNTVRCDSLKKLFLCLETIRRQSTVAVDNQRRAKDNYHQYVIQFEDGDIKSAISNAGTLDKLLIALIAHKKRDAEKNHLNKIEPMRPTPLFDLGSNVLSDELIVEAEQSDSIKRIISKFDHNANMELRYQYIIVEISRLLDLTDPLEREMFQAIDRIIKAQFFRPYIDEDEVNSILEFLQQKKVAEMPENDILLEAFSAKAYLKQEKFHKEGTRRKRQRKNTRKKMSGRSIKLIINKAT